MKRPKQLPAVDRDSTKCASVPTGGKVGPSFDWGGLASSLIPIATSLLA
jgi:hypothetical protein